MHVAQDKDHRIPLAEPKYNSPKQVRWFEFRTPQFCNAL